MKKTYIRISPDIDVLCINSDSCCASAYGDEIYNDSPWLGPRFSIVVPGIEEWVKRYEDATDLQKQQLSLPLTGFHGITRDYVSLKQFGNKCQGVTRCIMNHHSKIIVAP